MISRSQLRQNVIVDGRPLTTLMRLAVWSTHVCLRRPAKIRIGRGGPIMELQPRARSFGSTSLYMKRLDYEPYLAFIAERIAPGDICWDVGANFGVYALVMASRGASVTAFEPGREAREQLERNLELNPALRIQVIPLAASLTSGTGSLFHVGGPTTFSLGDDGTADTESEHVGMIALDEWEDLAQAIHFIKIDVEGHEPSVLLGSRRTLARYKPVLLFENSASALKRNALQGESAFALLHGLGYAIYALANGPRLTEVTTPYEANFFAIHPSSKMRSRFEPLMGTSLES